MIIGLTGTIASGKGVVAEFFKKKGFVYLSLSDELREKAREVNVEITRENLQRLGNKLREEKGKGVLAELVKSKVLNYGYRNVVIDGLRNPGEIEVVKKLKHFFLIAVDASKKVRFERIKKRNRENDPTIWEDFIKLDEKDKGEGQNESGQSVAKCMEQADFTIINDGDLRQVQKEIDEIYEKILLKLP